MYVARLSDANVDQLARKIEFTNDDASYFGDANETLEYVALILNESVCDYERKYDDANDLYFETRQFAQDFATYVETILDEEVKITQLT